MTEPGGRAEVALARRADGEFTEDEVAGLPEPVQRYLRTAIAPATPLATAARLRMEGRIKVGRWLPFRAQEVLAPHRGFVWAARAAGVISGSDRFVDGRGAMSWKLAGIVPVMRAGGPDVSRSAAQRAAAEAVWVPTALLARFGVEWRAENYRHLIARYGIAGHPIALQVALGPDGLAESVLFPRWGDPDGAGTYGLHPFGGEFTAHRTFDGVTVPAEGRLGWHYGTDRWSDGEFFRFRVTDLTLLTTGAP